MAILTPTMEVWFLIQSRRLYLVYPLVNSHKARDHGLLHKLSSLIRYKLVKRIKEAMSTEKRKTFQQHVILF